MAKKHYEGAPFQKHYEGAPWWRTHDDDVMCAVRATDPDTSHIAALASQTIRAKQRTLVLAAYVGEWEGDQHPALSDEDAGLRAEIPTAHKRCSELLRDGLIESRGVAIGTHGVPVRICSLTTKGMAVARLIHEQHPEEMHGPAHHRAHNKEIVDRQSGFYWLMIDVIIALRKEIQEGKANPDSLAMSKSLELLALMKKARANAST